MIKKFFGDRAFLSRVFALTLPIMLQNGITNFVNMLDNIMIGRVGTAGMTGTAVANQLMFVFNLCIFGAVSGAGIFVSQFFGSGDEENVRRSFRFKLLFCSGLCILGIAVFLVFGDTLISSYLQGEGDSESIALSMDYAKRYLSVMLIGLLPYTVAQCYSSTLRECMRATPPMVAGVTAVLVNLVLNYILIFGNLGAPALGVEGAAIATVISRFAELLVIYLWIKLKPELAPYTQGVLSSLYVPRSLVSKIMKKGMPLMINEAMWASGIAVLNQCYSVRGLDVVSAVNIQQTFFNVFSVAFMSIGVAAGIIIGNCLGADEKEEAVRVAKHLARLSVAISILVGGMYFLAAFAIPEMYNTTVTVKHLARDLMCIAALAMPLDAYAHVSYFTLRSGGKVLITILFDSCFVWVVSVPTAFLLSRYTAIPILPLFAICQGENFIKDVLGYIFVKQGKWVKNITT